MANKPLLVIGGICVALALASFAGAWAIGEAAITEMEKVGVEEYIQGPNTSFAYEFTDSDGLGSAGWYLMMDGEYLDEDGDGLTDACQNVTFSITDSEGIDVTEDASLFSCQTSEDEFGVGDQMWDPLPDDGRIVFAYVCATVEEDVDYECFIGENYTITSDSQLYLFDNDELQLAYADGVVGLIGGGLLGAFSSCCCGLGGILLLIGLLTGGKPTQTVGYMPQQGVAPGMQVPDQGNQSMGQMAQQQYTVGADIDSSSVADVPVSAADAPVSVWDN